jgi:hypothetical protein
VFWCNPENACYQKLLPKCPKVARKRSPTADWTRTTRDRFTPFRRWPFRCRIAPNDVWRVRAWGPGTVRGLLCVARGRRLSDSGLRLHAPGASPYPADERVTRCLRLSCRSRGNLTGVRSRFAADAALVKISQRPNGIKVATANLEETGTPGRMGFTPSTKRADMARPTIAAGEIRGCRGSFF